MSPDTSQKEPVAKDAAVTGTPVGGPAGAPAPDLPSRHFVSAVIVMGSTFLSRLLGFIRIALIGAIFGASGNADVLNLVFNIPNNLRKLLAEGALSSAFLPVLTRCHVEDPTGERSRRIVRQLIGFQFFLLVPLLVLASIFAQPIVNTILAFPEPERQLLAARLFRFMIHYVLLLSVAAVFMGTLNSHQRFLVPALAPLLFSVAVIGSVLLLHRRMGVFSMAVGVLLGGLGQMVIQIPPILRRGYTPAPLFRFRDPDFRRILRQWLPVLSTSSIFAVNQQISLFFASGLADGSGSALTNALVFWQLPFGIFSVSIVTVLFPLMSRQAAEGDFTGFARSAGAGLRALALLLIPAGMGLALLGRPVIAVALQRGAFTVEATALAANVLRGYSIGLFSVGAFTFLQRIYYALDNYRTPLKIALITMVIDVGLSLWLKETRLGVVGLSIANSTAFTTGLILFLLVLNRKVKEFRVARLANAVLRGILASLSAAAVLFGIRAILARAGLAAWWTAGSGVVPLLLLLVEAVPPALTVVLVYRLMGIDVRRLVRRKRSAVIED